MEQLGGKDEAGDWKEQNTYIKTFETLKTKTKKPTCVSVVSPNPTVSVEKKKTKHLCFCILS